jgi:hypothetical protein
MTNRVSYQPQDFEKKCKQAERDHESRKLDALLERVKRQIADQGNPGSRVDSPRPSVMTITSGLSGPRRAALFER